jgi:class 3 adenylate cyclase
VDVSAWLKNLGLGQYEAAFRDNAIDGDLLPSLTAEDLRDLGVTIVGHRRKLLDAMAALGAASKPAAPPAAAGPPATLSAPAVSSQPQPGSGVDAERRPITVMFCDLVGSTSLVMKLDAEDWRNLVNDYLDEASAAVTGLGGHVLKKLGDGLMALFGYPTAQENDAERALRTALAIQRALADLNARNTRAGAPELAARIGLDSGPVVVDATGEVFGEVPNVAERVQALAEPGAVLVTAAVQRQVAGLFVAEDKGAHALRGVPAPVGLYRIVRVSGGRRASARTPTRLVGREGELDLLGQRWERARKGEGQLALVVGEPGIGKSRLIQEFRARLGETPHTFVEWSSSQLLQNTPLHPLAEWGRQRFGGSATPADQRLSDLESTLGLIGLHSAEYAPLIAPLVDVPLPEGRMAKLAPEELRRRQLAALVAWILAGARSQAIALAFEDLHWADPTTLDLMGALAERGAQAPLFIIATARPEFRSPWSLRPHHSVIALAPLDRAQVARMVGEISSRQALSEEVVEGVSERTGGVPLFVEEVTRLLLERGTEGVTQAIPPTLQQSLAARLDRLGEAREVAQIGAVLGRDFSYALLSAVAGAAVAAADYRAVASVADRGPRRAAKCLLSFQARADPRRGLRESLEEPAPGATSPRRRGVAQHKRRVRGDRPSFHGGRARRFGNQMVGKSGRPGAAPLGLPGGDRPSRQGDRHGGQGGGRGAAAGGCGCLLEAAAKAANRLRSGDDVVRRLRRRGNENGLRARRRACRQDRRLFRAFRGVPRSVDPGDRARRVKVGA